MSDYFDLIEQELRLAVRRRAHMRLAARLRLRHSRALLVALACVAVGVPAIAAAAGAFQTGTPVAPAVPARPDAFDGVALVGSARVLSLRVADPDGGLPWGLRLNQTTRGVLCVQPGRVLDGRIGVLGIDDAFADDGRFHPFSADYVDQVGCAGIDGAGHAFVAPMDFGLPASALTQSCVPGRSSGSSSGPGREVAVGRGPICPGDALRNVSYGMLGPDAVSYSYIDAAGHLVTRPTSGPDGAFLIVVSEPNPCAAHEFCFGTLIGADPTPGELIRRITYRSGKTCSLSPQFSRASHFQRCPSVGYVAPRAQRLGGNALLARVRVRDLGLERSCFQPHGQAPCGAHPPAGAHVVPGKPSYILDVTFTGRASVHSVAEHYWVSLKYPPVHNPGCQIGYEYGPIDEDSTAGQEIRYQDYVPQACAGTFQLRVTYHRPGVKSLPVGSATFTLPPER